MLSQEEIKQLADVLVGPLSEEISRRLAALVGPVQISGPEPVLDARTLMELDQEARTLVARHREKKARKEKA